ncbi:MAG: signal peptidase I [Saccharofermentans sp.]|nr:signal peptidase I [Saccharofermentans sp.]
MKKHDKSDNIEVTPENRKQMIIATALEWFVTIAVGVLVGVLIVLFVAQKDVVYGESMEPTLESGFVVFTEKISTYFHHYNRGDIVILDGQGMEGYYHEECLIKRIVGLPGETIRIADGVVYIKEADGTDFFVLPEPYLPTGASTDMMSWGLERGYDEITLGEDEYYCLGDNRYVSNDSRNLGPFTSDRIRGIAFIILSPISRFGFI